MKKNVLIPTDFTIESLNVVKFLLQNRPNDCRYNIILLHGAQAPDTITELLFFSKSKMLASLSNRSFEEACGVIKNKYASGIASMRTDLFSGYTQAAFNNYLLANRIEEIYIPNSYHLHAKNPKSIDLLPFITKCKQPVNKIEWKTEALLPEKGSLAEIFYNGVVAN
ncbi:hypothetical protein SAMN05421747_1305 [Parapedobacter composti]|uniref:Universal stress protein family protein n=1 Tax=Parapedobacter composti TaxID=623281 RepID=A0A1I1M7B8_9SPHI|nr:hypothetical protein [Parapedobacter composti]SFC81244.1 hypothetical protein SAMN05421747_1305 [Parapedobacter composti]